MANILVLGVKAPFTRGGAEVLNTCLVNELKNRGHTVDVVELPMNAAPKEKLLAQAAIWRSYDFSNFSGKNVDLIICTKFPSYFAQHPKKSIWMVHQHRALYDLYGSWSGDFSDDPRDEYLRTLLVSGDTKAISESSAIAGISNNVVERLKKFNNINAEILYPPLPLGERYRSEAYSPYILSVGRLCHIKRVEMMIRAMPTVHHKIKLIIVGAPDELGIMEFYKNEIAKGRTENRVEFAGRVSDEELIKLYSNALGVYYAPFDEDYGYVTLEAMASGRPVITTNDSGGVLEFVRHNETGLVADPNPDSIAKMINMLVEDNALPPKLGAAAKNEIQKLGLTSSGWEQIINYLLSPIQ